MSVSTFNKRPCSRCGEMIAVNNLRSHAGSVRCNKAADAKYQRERCTEVRNGARCICLIGRHFMHQFNAWEMGK